MDPLTLTETARKAFLAIDGAAHRLLGPVPDRSPLTGPLWERYEAFPGWREALTRYQEAVEAEGRAYTVSVVCRPCGCVAQRYVAQCSLLPGWWTDRLTPAAFQAARRTCGECRR